MSKYTNIDWKHIQEEVLEMQRILKENGNPDPAHFRSPGYDELRNDTLTALSPFTGKEEYFFTDEEWHPLFVTTCDTPFAKMLIAKIRTKSNFTDDMLAVIDELLLDAYSIIIDIIPTYEPEKSSFETFVVGKCYFAMLDSFKKYHATKKTVTDETGKRKKIYITHDSFDRELNKDGQTLRDRYIENETIGYDSVSECFEPDEESEIHPFTEDEFDRVFPKDYFMQEERKLVKILLSEKNSEFANFTHNLSEWIQKNKQENTTTENDCEYFYDTIIDYICSKGNPVSLAKFLGNTGESFSSKLKELGLERPSHNAYSADYIYSTCLRIKRRRDRLNRLTN